MVVSYLRNYFLILFVRADVQIRSTYDPASKRNTLKVKTATTKRKVAIKGKHINNQVPKPRCT